MLFVARWRKSLRIFMTTCLTTRPGWRWSGTLCSAPTLVHTLAWSAGAIPTLRLREMMLRMTNSTDVLSLLSACHITAVSVNQVLSFTHIDISTWVVKVNKCTYALCAVFYTVIMEKCIQSSGKHQNVILYSRKPWLGYPFVKVMRNVRLISVK